MIGVDTSFDFRSDAGGRDPDSASPTLLRFHRLLWSKPLPGGAMFNLDDTTPGVYLHHRSRLGEFFLASDSIIPTFTRWKRMQDIVGRLPEEENEAFRAIGYTIGGMMVFPGNQVDGKQTINAARGLNGKIADRMDLTLECIRLHYRGADSPLGDTLSRYGDFFALFEDFHGYVEFFLLQDLVDERCSAVRFFMPFNHFNPPARPQDIDSYRAYRDRSVEFVQARNRRIDQLRA